MGISASILSNCQQSVRNINQSSEQKLRERILSQNDFISRYSLGTEGFSSVICVLNRKHQHFYALKKTSIVNISSQKGEQQVEIEMNPLKNEFLALKRIGTHPFIVGLKYAFHDFKEFQ